MLVKVVIITKSKIMIRLITIIKLMICMNINVNACSMELIRFISTEADTVILSQNDIIKIDTLGRIIKISNSASQKILLISSSIKEIQFCNSKNEWEKLEVISARSSERKPPFNYILKSNGSILFYGEHEIAYEGEFIFKLAKKYKIPIE